MRAPEPKLSAAGRLVMAAGDMRRAIIDIGSNTVRLVIYGPPLRVPVVLYNEKVSAKLGRGVAEDGRLGGKASAAALAAVARYALLLKLQGITDVQCVATAAVRDASNGAKFLTKLVNMGLNPRLLTGEEEAIIGAHGVMAAFPHARGLVGDLGGGSLELCQIGDDAVHHAISLPLGSLRLPALRSAGATVFTQTLRNMLQGKDWSGVAGQNFYLVGGSWRALGRYAMSRANWPIDDPHGFELAADDAQKLVRQLLQDGGIEDVSQTRPPQSPTPQSPAVEGISASRMASLPDAAALLSFLLDELRPAKLVFSSWGLREGLLAERFDPLTRSKEPLLASVEAFTAGLDANIPKTAQAMAAWTAAVAPSDGTGDEVLRVSAAMLALASIRSEPNMRAKLAAEWALGKRWIGIDAAARAMLALAVRANNGRTIIPPELLRLAPITAPITCYRQALAWGLAVRLCRRFTGGSADAMAGSTLRIADGRLALIAREDLRVLYTETVAKDMQMLAECLGLEPVFQSNCL